MMIMLVPNYKTNCVSCEIKKGSGPSPEPLCFVRF